MGRNNSDSQHKSDDEKEKRFVVMLNAFYMRLKCMNGLQIDERERVRDEECMQSENS